MKIITRVALVCLALAVWAVYAVDAVPVRNPQASVPPRLAKKRRPRFVIIHQPARIAGPLSSPDGRLTLRIVGALAGQVVEARTGKPVGPVLRHTPRREQMRLHTWAFSPDGKWLATASSEGEIEDTVGEVCVWDLATGKRLARAYDGQYALGRVHSVSFSADSSHVIIYCDDISGQ